MKRAEKQKILSGVDTRTFRRTAEGMFDLNEQKEKEEAKPTLLLHSCCGSCSTSVIERLIRFWRITVYFYNPNITEVEEYERRRKAQIRFLDRYNGSGGNLDKVSYLEGPYEPQAFLHLSEGLEDEPEGRLRCTMCIRMRLEKTAETACLSGFDCFTTTLSVSPHKNFEIISELGQRLAMRYNLHFLNENFRKQAGFQRSVELSRQYGIYRQNYCGCRFSLRDRRASDCADASDTEV